MLKTLEGVDIRVDLIYYIYIDIKKTIHMRISSSIMCFAGIT